MKVNINLFNGLFYFFGAKSLECGVYFTLTGHLHSDGPHFRCSVGMWLVAATSDRACLEFNTNLRDDWSTEEHVLHTQGYNRERSGIWETL